MTERGDDDGFLRRWSRRKALARREGSGPARPHHGGAAPSANTSDREEAPPRAPTAPPAQRDPSPQTARAAPAVPPAAELPDIESLGPDADFSVFMREGVPDELRTLALRRLWRSSPTLANLDGLVDYGEDFTDAATVVKGMKTAYRVGRGMLRGDVGDAAPPERNGAGPGAAEEVAVTEAHEGVAPSPEDAPRAGDATEGTADAPSDPDESMA